MQKIYWLTELEKINIGKNIATLFRCVNANMITMFIFNIRTAAERNVLYANWGGQPSGVDEANSYAAISALTGGWFEQFCNKTRRYICEATSVGTLGLVNDT